MTTTSEITLTLPAPGETITGSSTATGAKASGPVQSVEIKPDGEGGWVARPCILIERVLQKSARSEWPAVGRTMHVDDWT